MTCQGSRAQTRSELATEAQRHGEDALGLVASTSIYRFKYVVIHAALRLRLAIRVFTQALLPVLLAFVACTVDNPATAGGSTETVNGHTAAMLYNPDGSPAVGATVRFVPVDFRPAGLPKSSAAAICSTTTDSDGRYSFASVPGGVYNIFGELSGNRSFQDSVPVAAGAAEADPDTLRAPGTLRGYVDLSNGLDYKTVYALVFGSFAYSTVDSTGAFALRNLAEGDYAMRFFTTLDDWRPLDTVLGVSAGVDSLLADTIRLAYRGLPIPRGLKVAYDTAGGVVNLSWLRASDPTVTRYAVLRGAPGDITPRVIALTQNAADTSYTIAIPCGYEETLLYRIAYVDSIGVAGRISDPVTVVSQEPFQCLRSATVFPDSGTPVAYEGDTVNMGICVVTVGPMGRTVNWYNFWTETQVDSGPTPNLIATRQHTADTVADTLTTTVPNAGYYTFLVEVLQDTLRLTTWQVTFKVRPRPAALAVRVPGPVAAGQRFALEILPAAEAGMLYFSKTTPQPLVLASHEVPSISAPSQPDDDFWCAVCAVPTSGIPLCDTIRVPVLAETPSYQPYAREAVIYFPTDTVMAFAGAVVLTRTATDAARISDTLLAVNCPATAVAIPVSACYVFQGAYQSQPFGFAIRYDPGEIPSGRSVADLQMYRHCGSGVYQAVLDAVNDTGNHTISIAANDLSCGFMAGVATNP